LAAVLPDPYMLTKISRKETLENYPKFPQSNNLTEEFIYPKVHSTFILTLQAKSVRGHTKKLSIELKRLCKILDFSNLLFLGDTKTAWLYQDNDYKPAKGAYNFLVDNNISKRFNGGLKVGWAKLDTFFYHFIWLTRSNASLPYFYFSDEKQNFLGHICQYGNLHVDILDKKITVHLNQAIAKTSFEYFKETHCYNQFSNFNRLSGRKTVV
jgi:hypothetical protein